MTNNSLKEYYIKLHELYNNGVNMLTALNQALTSNSSEVSINIYSDNNISNTVRIPSFLYLDNKIEQLETTINNLFDMPRTGEAWFQNTGNMYKLELVRSNSGPLQPDLDSNNINAGISINNFIKDLVNPRTFLKINVNNLPNNVEEMFMKKIVLLNPRLYNDLLALNVSSYEEYTAALYNYKLGIDYEEYDDTLRLPIKHDKYKSNFRIVSIIKDAYYDNSTDNHLSYEIELDTLEYTNADDSAQVYNLHVGDYLCLGNELVIYEIIDVNYSTTTVIIKEHIGHIALQPFYENSNMVLQNYTYDYSDYNYVEVPLEENQYIIVFLGTIYNGIRSHLSDGMLFDLSTIYMVNQDGSYMKDNNGNLITYLNYYNQFCNNIGDIILGLTKTAYPQLSNYNAYQLNELQNSDTVKQFVSNTINTEGLLSVLPINGHIFDDNTIDIIKNYHSQKTSLQSELNALTENINTTNNTLLTTDWSQETNISQNSLQGQLKNYYGERLTIEKQLNSVVGEINKLSMENNIISSTKYRVRGVSNISELDKYIKSITNSKAELIGLDVEYKYKAVTKETTNVVSIDNNVFTDWNKLHNIDRQRKLFFDESTNSFNIEFVNYDSVTNIVKWNQIDIPINPNEDVIIRVRYKYNIGQPFINLYTPWSNEVTVSFPIEYTENVELTTIISNNDSDVVSSKFTNKLINDGYEEHITNNLVVSNQTFYHMPENIYSGFNTGENNLLSLKEKLTLMCNDIDVYKDLIQTESQKRLSVFLQYDGKSIELFSNTTNKINIYNIDHTSDNFIKKEMNLVIKNTGDTPLNLYSIFPGQTDIALINCNYEYYRDKIVNYQRLPIFTNNEIHYQTLGQWIYFRDKNVYTNKSVLWNSSTQIHTDYSSIGTEKYLTISYPYEYFSQDNIQLGLANKNTASLNTSVNTNYIGFISKANGIERFNDNDVELTTDKYIYNDNGRNICVYKYEDIYGIGSVNGEDTKIYLDDKTSISQYIVNCQGLTCTSIEQYEGAFLYVNLENDAALLTKGGEKDNYQINVGDSVSIPVVFEYFLYNNNKTISKTLMFDIRKSLLEAPLNFVLEITANYNRTLEDKVESDVKALIDDATDII